MSVGDTGAAARRQNWLAWLLLIELICADLLFMAATFFAARAHILRRNPLWNIERDRGYAEFFQYSKWTFVALAMAFLLVRTKRLIYGTFLLIFLYFLADDATSIHETVGHWLIASYGDRPFHGLRPQDYGEVAVSAAAGLVLFGLLALAYWRNKEIDTRRFARRMTLLVVVLAVFGIGVDLLHIAVEIARPNNALLKRGLGILEDGGEMLVASVIVYVTTRHLIDRLDRHGEQRTRDAGPTTAPPKR